jgi:glycogen debranching enzyme
MKLFCFLFIFSFAMAQPKTADPVERTVQLLKQSTWADLYKTFAPSVDLAILNDGDIYAKDQAEVILNNFFNKNQPFAVKLIHQVNSNADLKFVVVTLTGKGGNYRTSISLRNNNGTFQINEFHIEAEKAR